MINKVILIGNLGNDPEVKTLSGGNKVANFSMATSESYKDKDGQKVTSTQWHKCVVWGKLADVCESYLKIGSKVFVEGSIEYREHEGKYYTDIKVRSLQMLDSKTDNQRSPNTYTGNPSPMNDQQDEIIDDLPF